MSYQFGHVDRDERIDLAADEPLGEAVRWNGLPTPLLTALVMAIFAGGLWLAYDLGTHHGASPAAAPGAVPLIRADSQPMKVKPEQPGGMPVPGRDRLIYSEQAGGPPVEKLLPPPEQPAPRPAPLPPPPAPVASVAAPAAPLTAPAAAIPAPPPRKPAPPARASAAAAEHGLPAVKASRPEPTAAAVPRSVESGPVRLQLASVRSVDAARIEWQRLKRDYPDLLGPLSADAVRADLGDRGVFYRIEVGSFARPGAAERLCRQLRQRHLECSIVR